MSDPLPPAAPNESRKSGSSTNPKKKSGRSPGGLITRVVVWGAVIALAVVVLFDVRARRAAQATADAWSTLLDERDAKEEILLPTELKDLAVGNPSVRPIPEDSQVRYFGYDVEDYVWSSPFREHVVRIVSDKGSFVKVVKIEAPDK
ncbi:MAG: hypothetical protein WD066_08350 [Planctomycetaceae bacterium]